MAVSSTASDESDDAYSYESDDGFELRERALAAARSREAAREGALRAQAEKDMNRKKKEAVTRFFRRGGESNASVLTFEQDSLSYLMGCFGMRGLMVAAAVCHAWREAARAKKAPPRR